MSSNHFGTGSSRAIEYDSEDGSDEGSDLVRSSNGIGNSEQAREAFGIDQLKNKPIPRLKKSSLFNTGSRNRRMLRARASFDDDNDSGGGFSSDESQDGDGKLKPRKRDNARQGAPRERRGSHAWAEKASRMRRSIRLKKGLHLADLLEERKDGKVIVRNNTRNKKVREIKLWKKELKNNLKGVAALLTGEYLMNAKLMGAKSFWKLSQLIFTRELELSKLFLIKTAKEIVTAVSKMHLKTKEHGLLSSDSVLLDRSLNVGLMKAKIVKVKGKFSVARLQSDILMLGVVLVELFCRREISSKFCPIALKAQSLEFTLAHGERNISMYQSYRTFKTKKDSKFSKKKETFADIEPIIRKELLTALNQVPELDNLDTLKKMILDCFSANPDERPFTLAMVDILKQTEIGFVNTQDIDVNADTLSILKGIMDHQKLSTAYVRGPRLVEFTQEKTAEQQKKEIENIKKKKRKDGIDSSAANGYVTDDSHFVEEPSDGEESVETDIDGDSRASDPDSEQVQHSIKPKVPPKKKKGGLNALSAFLKSTNTLTKTEQSMSKKQGGGSSRKPNSGKKPNLLSQFSQMNEDESEESDDEYMSVQESQIQTQKSIHTQVRNNYAIDSSDLAAFKEGFAKVAKKRAKKKRQRFDPKILAEKFQLQKRLSLENVEEILSQAERIMRDEPNLLRLKAPMTVVGDIHGQFFDLKKMMEECGEPGAELGKTNGEIEKQSYLFLGDYVDRGKFSCEVLFYLLASKIRKPENVWLLRGNHESKATSSYFGFKEECEKKYNAKVFSRCCEVFQAMPVAALVETPAGSFICLHGGISNNVREVDQFVELDRFKEPQMFGFLCDVLWADPINTEDDGFDDDSTSDGESDEDAAQAKRERHLERVLGNFFGNPLRGCSFRFGLGALTTFLENNKLVGLIRAHQVQQEGYTFHFQDLAYEYFQTRITGLSPNNDPPNEPNDVCPPVITVFSAPNYCGRYGNKGAYLNIFQKPNGVSEDVDLSETRYSPLSLLDPVQFEAAYEPEVIYIPSESARHTEGLKDTCPYMPVGYEDLFKKALSLQKVDFIKELASNAQEAYKNKSRREKKSSKSKIKLFAGSESDLSSKKSGNASNASNSADTGSVSTWHTFRDRMNNYEKAAKKKYNKALQEDMINEIHPELMQQKKDIAQKMVANTNQSDFNLPSQILLEENFDERRRTASMNLSKLQKEKSVKFGRSELIALQTLYLVIDSAQTGKIDAKALIEWTENGGGFLEEDDAEHTVKILDFDKDGFIGFEDFLIFAAACKKMYLAELYADILVQGL